MKTSRSRVEGGALLAVIALLCALAVVQHRWLGAIAEGERRKLTEEASEKAATIAQDVDRELTRVFLELRIDGKAVAERNGQAFFERFERWRADSPHAALIKAVFVADRVDAGPSQLLRFDVASRRFVEEAWPDALSKVRAVVDTAPDSPLPFPLPLTLTPVMAEVPALVFPVVNVVVNQQQSPEGVARHVGQIRELFMSHTSRGPVEIIVMDPAYLREKLVGAIAESRLGGDSSFVWSAVSNKDGSSVAGTAPLSDLTAKSEPDAKSPMLRVRFDDLDKSVLRGVLPGLSEERRESSVRLVVQLGGVSAPSRMNVVSSTGAPWTLTLRHREGSIDAAVRGQQRRNTALSASILGVLGLSAGLVFFSARRLRAIATQQVEFVAAVSHELRTPLAVIRSAADNLADGVVEGKDQAKRYGILIREESVRLADMVEHVLEFAGADSVARASRGPVDVSDAIRAAAKGMEGLADERGARVTVKVDGDLPKVNGDMSHITRAISNLIGNALKYGGDAPRVTVGVTRLGEGLEVSVADSGAGLDDSEIPRLFEPFYRGQRASEAHIPGSGLGLALVKRIVESHGGRVTASNGAHGGALFKIVLPTA